MPSLQKALWRMQRGAALAQRCGRQVKGRGFSPHNGIRKDELVCKSREVPRFLGLEPASFSTTAAYSFVFAVWGAIRFASLYEKYLLVLSTATKMA